MHRLQIHPAIHFFTQCVYVFRKILKTHINFSLTLLPGLCCWMDTESLLCVVEIEYLYAIHKNRQSSTLRAYCSSLLPITSPFNTLQPSIFPPVSFSRKAKDKGWKTSAQRNLLPNTPSPPTPPAPLAGHLCNKCCISQYVALILMS